MFSIWCCVFSGPVVPPNEEQAFGINWSFLYCYWYVRTDSSKPNMIFY